MNFLFLIYFFGIILAVFQDFKRREIDDWLNLFLLFSGLGYLIILNQFNLVSFTLFAFFMLGVSFLLYYARFFAGGDATLLFALTPLFYNLDFLTSITNFSYFFVFLIISGTIYSLFYAIFFLIRDFKKIKPIVIQFLRNRYIRFSLFLSIIFLLASFFNFIFFILFFYVVAFIFLFIIAKSLENISMTRKISSKDLRVGDWLAKDVSVKNKTIKFSWDGLNQQDINFLKKNTKFILVKEGIPYALAFLFAAIIYYFRNFILILLQ